MKKSVRLLLVLSLIFVIIILPIYLFLSRAIIHWEVILIEFSILILTIIVLAYISRHKYITIVKNYNSGKVDEALLLCKKYIRWNPEGILKQNVYMIMAIIFFDKSDDDQFNASLNNVKNEKMQSTKLYWQTMNFLIKGNLAEAKIYFQKFIDSNHNTPKNSQYVIFENVLKSLFGFINDKNEETKCNLVEAKKNINNIKVNDYIEHLMP